MKKLSFLICCTLVLSFFLQSCQKNELHDQAPIEIKWENGQYQVTKSAFDNGMMIFDQSCDLAKVSLAIEKNNYLDLEKMEKNYQFKSLKSKIDEQLLALNQGKTTDYDKRYIALDESTNLYTINYPFYYMSSILNENAMLRLEDKVLLFDREYVVFFDKKDFLTISDPANISAEEFCKNIHMAPVQFEAVSEGYYKQVINNENNNGSDMVTDRDGCTSEPQPGATVRNEGTCTQTVNGTNGLPYHQTLTKIYTTSWRCPQTEGYYYCGRLWATVSAFNFSPSGNPISANNTVKATLSGYYYLSYYIGTGSPSTFVNFYSQSQNGNTMGIYTFTIFDIVGLTGTHPCLDNTYSGSSWGLLSQNGFNGTPSSNTSTVYWPAHDGTVTCGPTAY